MQIMNNIIAIIILLYIRFHFQREISLSDGDTDRYKMSGVIVTR